MSMNRSGRLTAVSRPTKAVVSVSGGSPSMLPRATRSAEAGRGPTPGGNHGVLLAAADTRGHELVAHLLAHGDQARRRSRASMPSTLTTA